MITKHWNGSIYSITAQECQRKSEKKNIYKEITMTSKVALITGMFIAAVMILVKILYKKMPVYWTKIYLAEAVVMIIGMTAIS